MSRAFIPKKNTPDKDLVMTPNETAKDIIEHFSPKGIVLDPCRGEGAFYNNYPTNCSKDYCEISEGIDFLDYNKKVDWIITNPPWSKIKEFLKHSMSICDNIVFLTSINHYSTKARLRIIYEENNFGIKEMYCVKTPPNPWPQMGFQIAAVHISKGYNGGITFSGNIGY